MGAHPLPPVHRTSPSHWPLKVPPLPPAPPPAPGASCRQRCPWAPGEEGGGGGASGDHKRVKRCDGGRGEANSGDWTAAIEPGSLANAALACPVVGRQAKKAAPASAPLQPLEHPAMPVYVPGGLGWPRTACSVQGALDSTHPKYNPKCPPAVQCITPRVSALLASNQHGFQAPLTDCQMTCQSWQCPPPPCRRAPLHPHTHSCAALSTHVRASGFCTSTPVLVECLLARNHLPQPYAGNLWVPCVASLSLKQLSWPSLTCPSPPAPCGPPCLQCLEHPLWLPQPAAP